MYLAVLPGYRTACVEVLKSQFGSDLTLFSGPSQLDTSVRTGVPLSLYTPVKNVSIGGRLLLQLGHVLPVIRSRTAILDLNPRSVTAWFILGVRRLSGRRTLLWGHLHPRSGQQSRTNALRRAMRSMADGTVLYGYDSVLPAQRELPGQQTWVAPNSLYEREDMGPADCTYGGPPRIVYVGRLVASKKVHLAIEALAAPELVARGVSLDVVGDGEQADALRDLAASLGLGDRVKFHGSVSDPAALKSIYCEAACAVSPGYAGLSLTQSLGFGVPVVVADDEPHAPEIELARFGGVTFFQADSPADLSKKVATVADARGEQDRAQMAKTVATAYSAEAMAQGLVDALRGDPQNLKEDGWPA